MHIHLFSHKVFASLTILLIALPAMAQSGEPDLVIDRFDAERYTGWHVSGAAFGHGPAKGPEFLQRLEISNSPDHSLACSEMEGDKPQGRLTSEPFIIQRDYIGFRIAGGNYETHTCMNLLVDGEIVRSAVGWRSDRLDAASWDVREWKGQQARIESVDEASGDWGHILVDEIIQSDAPDAAPTPVAPLYQEALRPQFHITARQWTMNRLNPGMREEGWINDVNGLIYYDGEWHFFAQRWNKCWLHLVSDDLIHWEELDPAFWEEQLNSGVQSGYTVIDYDNTSGLSSDPDNPPMVAFWSRNDNRSQCISYSLDHGRTWTHYPGNPILEFPERDPKVMWYEPGQHWVMVLYGNDQYHFFKSDNLLDWTNTGHPIPDSFECPDFFELPIDGDLENTKWVLVHGDGWYQLGSFDGQQFTPDGKERLPTDTGDFYATQSFHNTNTGDGRRIQMAWMRFSNFPDMPFSQQITFPCALTLRSTPVGPRIYRQPIDEIKLLHRGEFTWTDHRLRAGQHLPLEPAGRLYHVKAEVDIADGARAIFNIRGTSLVLSGDRVELGPHSRTVREPITSVEILIDRTSTEVFVNEGELSISEFNLLDENGLSVRAEHGTVTFSRLVVHPLGSIWPRPNASTHDEEE